LDLRFRFFVRVARHRRIIARSNGLRSADGSSGFQKPLEAADDETTEGKHKSDAHHGTADFEPRRFSTDSFAKPNPLTFAGAQKIDNPKLAATIGHPKPITDASTSWCVPPTRAFPFYNRKRPIWTSPDTVMKPDLGISTCSQAARERHILS
jgi:hypothetical protein